MFFRHRRQSKNLAGYLIQKESSTSLQHQCNVGSLLQYNQHSKHFNHYINKSNLNLSTGCGSRTLLHCQNGANFGNKETPVLETLIIGGVPFHVVHKEVAKLSQNSANQPPIYETIDDSYECQNEVNIVDDNTNTAVIDTVEDDRIYAELENPGEDLNRISFHFCRSGGVGGDCCSTTQYTTSSSSPNTSEELSPR